MARRDLDVVIGARTDAASFKRAESRTRGFLSRLRGAGADSGEGAAEAALQRTSRAAETISKIAQAMMLINEGIGTFNASLEIGRGIMAGMEGDAVAMDEALLRARDSINQTMMGRIGGTIGEAIFGDERDAERITKQTEEAQARNQAALEQTNRIRMAAQKIIDDEATAQRLAGLEGVDLAKEQARIKAEALLEELEILKSQNRNRQVALKLDEAIAAVERQRDRRIEELDRRVEGATQRAEGRIPAPTVTSGLLISGNIEAARAGMNVQQKQFEEAKKTTKNTSDTVDAIRELIQATNISSLSRPVLQ